MVKVIIITVVASYALNAVLAIANMAIKQDTDRLISDFVKSMMNSDEEHEEH